MHHRQSHLIHRCQKSGGAWSLSFELPWRDGRWICDGKRTRHLVLGPIHLVEDRRIVDDSIGRSTDESADGLGAGFIVLAGLFDRNLQTRSGVEELGDQQGQNRPED